MDIRRKEVLIRSIIFITVGTFGILYNLVIFYDILSIIFSIIFFVMGTAAFVLGLAGKLQLKKRAPPKSLLFHIILWFGLGIMSLVAFLLTSTFSSITLHLSIMSMGIAIHQMWLHFKREVLFTP
ncbi:MAG: hypothetical protein HWN65_15465 [Candidatus Helarchaeota archaeon]|nr:hypothetical protein [Candidatus Helarchaeota archaeon]